MNAVAEVWAFLCFFSVPIGCGVFVTAIVIRVLIALVRRKPRSANEVIAPLFSAGAVESEFYGFKPALEQSIWMPPEWSTAGAPPHSDTDKSRFE